LGGGKFANGAVTGAFAYAASADWSDAQPHAPSSDGSLPDWKKGREAAAEANLALAPYNHPYGSINDLLLDWSDAVVPVTRKYGFEIGSFISKGDGGYRFGPAFSSGQYSKVIMNLAEDAASGIEVAWVHTHPTNTYFSGRGGDLEWTDIRAGMYHRTIDAYVAWPNSQIYGWRSGTPYKNRPSSPMWKVR
jgi:hypothetical protein